MLYLEISSIVLYVHEKIFYVFNICICYLICISDRFIFITIIPVVHQHTFIKTEKRGLNRF